MRGTAQLPWHMTYGSGEIIMMECRCEHGECWTSDTECFHCKVPTNTAGDITVCAAPAWDFPRVPSSTQKHCGSFFGAVLKTPLAHMTSPCLEMGNNPHGEIHVPQSPRKREAISGYVIKRNGSLKSVEYTSIHQGTPMVSLMVNMPHSVVIAYSTSLHGVSWCKDRQAGNSTLTHYH